MRHNKLWNVNFEPTKAENLVGLDIVQARSIAALIDRLVVHCAASDLELFSVKEGLEVPDFEEMTNLENFGPNN